MSSMLDTLLDIKQLEAGIVRREMVDFPINAVLDQLRTQFTVHAAAHGLGWRVVPSSLSARSDPRLLEQVIRNLLSNAVKYTNEGKILLGCRRRGDMLRIEVWDTGGLASLKSRFGRSSRSFTSSTTWRASAPKASGAPSSSAWRTC